jgi:hypothetical protein
VFGLVHAGEDHLGRGIDVFLAAKQHRIPRSVHGRQ